MDDWHGHAAPMAANDSWIAEIVERRAGGFRLILRMMSGQGVPVIESCATIFARLRDAEDYAARVCAPGPDQSRCA
jgi:hypothetical protein